MTYPEFWRAYLAAHSDPRTRVLHYLGTVLALVAIVVSGVSLDWRWLVVAPIVGYAVAWFGHFAFERNRPATFGHPTWSLINDFRMLILFAAGKLGAELQLAGVTARRPT
jgi:hypothetical protein